MKTFISPIKMNMKSYFNRTLSHQILKNNLQKFTTLQPVLETNKVTQEEPEFLQMVQMFFDKASEHVDVPKSYLNLIKHTKAAIRLSFPLVRDDGSIEMIDAFRAQHSLHYLPTKGGTRYSDHIGKKICTNSIRYN